MRAFFLACPLAIMTLNGALAGGWGGARTEVVWSGVYAGLQAGYTHAELEDRLGGLRAERDFGDVSGGLYAGYMHQLASRFVLGAEADLNVANLRRTGDAKVYRGSRHVDDVEIYDRIKWTGGLRARVGYAAGQFQPYVTGGLGIVKYRGDLVNDKAYGWTVGAGVEYAATENLIARMEYRYSDYGEARERPGHGIPTVDVVSHDLRMGLALKF